MYHIFLLFFFLSPFLLGTSACKDVSGTALHLQRFYQQHQNWRNSESSNFVTSLKQIGDDLAYLISNFQQMVSEYKELIIAINFPLTSYFQPWKLELSLIQTESCLKLSLVIQLLI